jgi:hypothetical protein
METFEAGAANTDRLVQILLRYGNGKIGALPTEDFSTVPAVVFSPHNPEFHVTASTVSYGMVRHPQSHVGLTFLNLLPTHI